MPNCVDLPKYGVVSWILIDVMTGRWVQKFHARNQYRGRAWSVRPRPNQITVRGLRLPSSANSRAGSSRVPEGWWLGWTKWRSPWPGGYSQSRCCVKCPRGGGYRVPSRVLLVTAAASRIYSVVTLLKLGGYGPDRRKGTGLGRLGGHWSTTGPVGQACNQGLRPTLYKTPAHSPS